MPCAPIAPDAAGTRAATLPGSASVYISWPVGGGDADCAYDFMFDVARRLKQRIQLTTDGHGAYLGVIPAIFDRDIAYAQLVKAYDPDPRGLTSLLAGRVPWLREARDHRQPRQRAHFAVVHRVQQPHAEDEQPSVYPADQCALQEAGEARPHARALRDLVRLREGRQKPRPRKHIDALPQPAGALQREVPSGIRHVMSRFALLLVPLGLSASPTHAFEAPAGYQPPPSGVYRGCFVSAETGTATRASAEFAPRGRYRFRVRFLNEQEILLTMKGRTFVGTPANKLSGHSRFRYECPFIGGGRRAKRVEEWTLSGVEGSNHNQIIQGEVQIVVNDRACGQGVQRFTSGLHLAHESLLAPDDTGCPLPF